MNRHPTINRYILRNKIEKIIQHSNISPCRRHQMHIKALTNKIQTYYHSNEYYNKLIFKSLRFDNIRSPTGKISERSKTLIEKDKEAEVDYYEERDFIIEEILKQISLDELELICKNIEFYIRDKFIRDLLGFVDEENNKLYQILNKEEKDNKIYGEKDKILHLFQKKKNDIIHKRNKYKFYPSADLYCTKEEDIEEIKIKEEEKKLISQKIKKNKRRVLKELQNRDNSYKVVNKLITQSQKEFNSFSETLSPRIKIKPLMPLSKKALNNRSEKTSPRGDKHNTIINSKKRQLHFDSMLTKRKIEEKDNDYYISKYKKEIKDIFVNKQEELPHLQPKNK